MLNLTITKNLQMLLLYVFALSLFGQDKKNLDYKERFLLEDFESIKLTNQSIKVQANTNYLPDIRMSKNITSPDLVSNTSLLIRISSEGKGIPIDLLFPKPYQIENYIIEFEFYVYSNYANGDLFLYILDTNFQKHKIMIANLNYDGWKSFRIPIGNVIAQSNFTIGKSNFIKLTGIQFNPTKKETKDKEDMIAIDDIFIIKRVKYKLPEGGITAFH
jgi:hypothetical protein